MIENLLRAQLAVNTVLIEMLLGIKPLTHRERKRIRWQAKQNKEVEL